MNNEAVLRLFDTFADDAFRLAYTYWGSRPNAEDVVQDVFVKLIRSDITITKGKEKSYILTMTANRCRDFLKSADVVLKAPFEDAADVRITANLRYLMTISGQRLQTPTATTFTRLPG